MTVTNLSEPISEQQLIELLLRAFPAHSAPSDLASLLFLIERQPIKLGLVVAYQARSAGIGPPSPQNDTEEPPPDVEPDPDTLATARLHARGQTPRAIDLSRIARELRLSMPELVQTLNLAGLLVSFRPVEGPTGATRWPPIFFLSAALGACDAEVKLRCLSAYVSEADYLEWAEIPLDAETDGFLRWVISDVREADPPLAVGFVATLGRSPEAFRVATGYLRPVFTPLLGTNAVVPLIRMLSGPFRRLAREAPACSLVHDIARHALERSGDVLTAATALDVLICDNQRPTRESLALASAAATCVLGGRIGWRTPFLREVLKEAAIHGAPGCRRAALMLLID